MVRSKFPPATFITATLNLNRATFHWIDIAFTHCVPSWISVEDLQHSFGPKSRTQDWWADCGIQSAYGLSSSSSSSKWMTCKKEKIKNWVPNSQSFFHFAKGKFFQIYNESFCNHSRLKILQTLFRHTKTAIYRLLMFVF